MTQRILLTLRIHPYELQSVNCKGATGGNNDASRITDHMYSVLPSDMFLANESSHGSLIQSQSMYGLQEMQTEGGAGGSRSSRGRAAAPASGGP